MEILAVGFMGDASYHKNLPETRTASGGVRIGEIP